MALPNGDLLCHVGMPWAQVTELGNQVASRSVGMTATALTTVGAGTITAAGIVGRLVTRSGAQSGSAFTDTTDTATAIIAAQTNVTVATTAWSFIYQNNTNAPATITGGTGVTVSGVTVVPANTWAEFLVSVPTATTVTMVGYEMGRNASLPPAKFTSINVTAGTLAAGVITGAEFVYVLSTNATPGAQTVRTAAQMLADTPNAQVGMSYSLRIANSGAGTLTLTADGGATVTLTGTMTIPTATFRDFIVTFTAAATATIQTVGDGTYT
jgi:hypothetical protein